MLHHARKLDIERKGKIMSTTVDGEVRASQAEKPEEGRGGE